MLHNPPPPHVVSLTHFIPKSKHKIDQTLLSPKHSLTLAHPLKTNMEKSRLSFQFSESSLSFHITSDSCDIKVEQRRKNIHSFIGKLTLGGNYQLALSIPSTSKKLQTSILKIKP